MKNTKITKNKFLNLIFKNELLDRENYINILNNYITHLNIDNVEMCTKFYEKYKELYLEFSTHTIRMLSKKTNNVILGIGDKLYTNTNINFYLSRGHTEENSKKIITLRQNTTSVGAIMKHNNCDKKQSLKIMEERRIKKRENFYNNHTSGEIKKINYSRGNSTRKEYYLDVINPDTNTHYTKEEIELMFYNRYNWNSGKKMSKDYCERMTTSIVYWLNKGYDLEEATEKLIERQTTFSLDICIEKYGVVLGLERWQQRQDKWMKTMNDKSPEEKLKILKKKVQRSNFWSVESVNFFDFLLKYIDDDKKLDYYYKNNEYYINSNKKFYMYDFTIRNLKIIIEYNGSHVHPNRDKLNESKWKKWKNPYNKKNADECYKFDKIKIDAAKEKGFDVIVIWDYEVKKEKFKTKNKLIDIINKKYKEVYDENK